MKLNILLLLPCLLTLALFGLEPSFAGSYQVKVTVLSNKLHQSFSRTVTSQHDLIGLFISVFPASGQPDHLVRDLLNQSHFTGYYGKLVPIMGFDPLYEALLLYFKAFNYFPSQKDFNWVTHASPINAIYWLSQLGQLLGQDLKQLYPGWPDPAHLDISEFSQSQYLDYGSAQMEWPLPTGKTSPYPTGLLSQVLTGTLYSSGLMSAGFCGNPPTYSGFVPKETANKDARQTLFLEDVICGFNWQHGEPTHPLQTWLQVMSSGISKIRITEMLSDYTWGWLMDLLSSSFKNVQIRISIHPTWYPFPVTVFFSGEAVVYLGKPMTLTRMLLNRLASQALIESFKYQDPRNNVLLHKEGFAHGTPVDPPELLGTHLARLENTNILSLLDNLSDYSNMVFNSEFSQDLSTRLQPKETIWGDSDKSLDFNRNLLGLVQQFLGLASPVSEIQKQQMNRQLYKLTLSAMSKDGNFFNSYNRAYFNARARQLEARSYTIEHLDDNYMISRPNHPSPQVQSYQEQLEKLLQDKHLGIAQVPKDGHCLFTSLGHLAQVGRAELRQQLILYLAQLLEALKHHKRLDRDQLRVWNQNGRDISWLRREINILSQGGWGSISTLGAFAIVIQNITGQPFEFYAVVPHGPSLTIYHVHPDGNYNEESDLPAGYPTILHDGINHWSYINNDPSLELPQEISLPSSPLPPTLGPGYPEGGSFSEVGITSILTSLLTLQTFHQGITGLLFKPL